ncbi:MAG: hypothetical protein GQ564_22615 [Bacteroidales bacterium]|nr:hypothetical protein [Bacteroidales bacterium]
MYEQVDKLKENKSRAVANSVEQRKGKINRGIPFIDNRPKAIVQKKLIKSMRQDNQTAQLQTLKNNNSHDQKQPVIQCYYNSNNFQMSNTAEFTDQGITKTDFTTTFEQPDTKIHTDYVNLPNIDISGNRRMAIEANASQAKVFYADNQTLADSNQKLAATGVDVRLAHAAGQILTIPSRDNIEPAKDITKVTPTKPDPLVIGNRVALTSFDDNSCDAVVKNIIGASSRVTVIADNVEKIGDAKAAHQIGGYVGKQKENQEVSTSQGAKTYDPDNLSDTELADKYATVAPNTMGTENQNLKINESANPDVGEGFLIQSLSNSGTDDIQGSTFQNKQAQLAAIQNLGNAQAGIDIMRQNLADNTKAMMIRWNEHFAGVVAKDGNDVVTLENYNRNVEIGSELQRIFNNLFTQFQDFRDFTWDTVDQAPPTPYMTTNQSAAFVINARAAIQQVGDEEQAINQAYSDALDEAKQTIDNVLNLNTVGANNLIYFKMYGAAAQSFHAKWKGTADNPITTRIRSSETEETKAASAYLANCIDDMRTILGGASVSPPWSTIYGIFAARGNTWNGLKNIQIGNINNFAMAKKCNSDIAVEFNHWKSDLRQAIADKVKQIVNDLTLADPNSRQELVTMIELEIANNNYSSFDFSNEGYQKAARYKKLQTLLPTANRL